MARRAFVAAGTAAIAVLATLSTSTSNAYADSGKKIGVIVMLKDQHTDLPATQAQRQARKAAVGRDQKPFLSQLKQVKAAGIKSFSLVNGFAAQVTPAEAARLAADPQVASVQPDRVVPRPQIAPAATGGTAKTALSAKLNTAPGTCPKDPAKPQLEPEALQLSKTAYDDPTLPQASKLATGKGVKVAILADGVDTGNQEFVRADGSKVYVDYQNFTGAGDVTDGTEHFGDASSIAAQGRGVYDLSNYASPNTPLPKGCNVRVRGMAPGVSLVGLNVFGTGNSLNSTLLQAIDYAVTVDNVDVVNESFGFAPLPQTFDDTVQQANDAAAAAGVTVVVSSGDEGPTGTVGSPAGDPHVITAAGETAFRVLAQASWDGFALSNGRWQSGQISAFSSGGVTAQGYTPDVVAPAERGWIACSKNVDVYQGCFTRDGRPTDIYPFGGTSESAPLISGEAALVIQAYKQAHGGAKPSPALVKSLITSTATDLGVPSDEQGAGQFNALAAVQAALSYKAPSPQGSGLVLGKTQLSDAAPDGTTVHDTVPVTNAGATTQTITARARTLGAARTLSAGTLTLDTTQGTLPTFFDQHFNSFRGYVKRTLTVPKGVDYLAVSAAYPPAGARVTEPQIALLGPDGTFVAEGYHSAGSGFARVDVHSPAPGAYTVVYSSIADPTLGFKGDIHFKATAQNFVSYGSASPSAITLKPGQTGAFQVTARAGDAVGDLSATLRLDSTSGTRVAVPWTVRSVISAARDHGRFSGVLSGANGGVQIKNYYLDVPAGQQDLSLGITLDNPNQEVMAALTDPNGQPLGFTSNVFNGSDTAALQFFRAHPQPGRWQLNVQLDTPTGVQTSSTFTGRLSFGAVRASASGLPTSSKTVLAAGKPVTASVSVKNTGVGSALFFADGRLSGTYADLPIISTMPTTGVPLANSDNAEAGQVVWPVPTETTGLGFTGTSTRPIALDAQFGTVSTGGNPDYYGSTGTDSASINVQGAPLAPGNWSSDATVYGTTGSTVVTDTADLAATAHTLAFDPGFTAAGGDIWLTAVSKTAPSFTPVTIAPGQTASIPVTITPTAAKGTTVHGTLYVDTYNTFSASGDELIAIPYTYTVG